MSKNLFFTSDSHLDHRNVIRFCNRPFSCAKEMNESIISSWNDVVGPNDYVYHLGDFCLTNKEDRWQQHLWRLNGKIHLVRGNHDKEQICKKVLNLPGIEKKLVWVKDYFEIPIQKAPNINQKSRIIACHYPFETWNRSHFGILSIHGHCHNNLARKKGRLDVGVDSAYSLVGEYRPFSFEEVYQYGFQDD